ncbi:hypothetical protein C8N35_101679 [Breoghania corrubedonensis]|uniref:Uncharacterized protein n=1 Tax=Breoghania corrubedonensis TaxID=665038 RepID=A0A2T5VFU8_9HYPH|nr:hypothetical protein C8N35_101679 [Breoghania corrubedonensis]
MSGRGRTASAALIGGSRLARDAAPRVPHEIQFRFPRLCGLFRPHIRCHPRLRGDDIVSGRDLPFPAMPVAYG